MYKELGSFAKEAWKRSPLWNDGEFLTAIACGLLSYFAFNQWPHVLFNAQEQLPNILTVVSILFGFVVSALVFYIQAAREWSKDDRVQLVAQKLIDWHVWTILTLLATLLLSLVLAVWKPVPSQPDTILRGGPPWPVAIFFALDVWLLAYGLFQIVNHTLNAWWVFKKLKDLVPRIDCNHQEPEDK